MTTLKKAVLGAAVTAALFSAQAMAEAGDIKLRVGAAGVYPTGDSETITAVGPTAKVEADSAWSLGLSLTYMFTDNIGLGVLGAYPFTHDVNLKGAGAADGKVAEVTQLPPTITVQYFFNNSSAFTPFVGAGLNYTTFWDEKTDGALAGTNLSLDDSWGYALEAGVDYDINDKWMVSAQVYYIDIDTKADTAVGNIDVQIDPVAYLFTAGYKF